jgi:uncharacterized membrane protein YcaP (DUF421 family)
VLLNHVVSILTFHSPVLARWIEGRAMVLIHNGKVNEVARRQAMITREELLTAVRANDCSGMEEVHYAILENTGEITVVRKKIA